MGLSPSLLQGTERLREGLVGVRMLEGLNINPPKGKYYAIVRNSLRVACVMPAPACVQGDDIDQ